MPHTPKQERRNLRTYQFFLIKGTFYLAGICTAALFFMITLAPKQYLPENAPGILSLQFSPTLGKFTEIINLWGEPGLRGYRSAMWLDYLFPAAYGLFFASLISRLNISSNKISPFFYFPLAAGLLDWLENTIHLLVTVNPAMISAGLVTVSFIISMGKWLLLLACVVFILIRLWFAYRQGYIYRVFFD